MTDVPCPFCDGYTGESIADTATHIFRSGDDAHKGYNYQSAAAAVRAEHPDAAEKTADSGGGGQAAAAEDPAMQGPQQPSQSSGGPDVGDECPECGGPLYDLRGEDTWPDADRTIPTPDEYYCGDCLTGFNWVADDE